MNEGPVKVTVTKRNDVQLRKLARALISLARRQLATEAGAKAERPQTGDAA